MREAQNLLVIKTATGSAQPVAAAIDSESWAEIVGTVGGDDTILVISQTKKNAHQARCGLQGCCDERGEVEDRGDGRNRICGVRAGEAAAAASQGGRAAVSAPEKAKKAASRWKNIIRELSGNGSYPLEPFSWELLKSRGVEVLFLATPHELSRELVPEALSRGLRIVDLSGAWRLKCGRIARCMALRTRCERAAELDHTAVYGLPELHREEIRDAALVANPGCYATSVIVPLAPLVRSGLVDMEHGVICDCKSGVSGAGKKPTPKTHFVEAADNFSAYSVFGHRHTGEILEQAGLHADELIFTPHLLPIPRGILSTIYLGLTRPVTPVEIEAVARVLRRRPMGSDFRAWQAAADSVLAAHELLRCGVSTGPGWKAAHRGVLPGQPDEGRGRPGAPEPERDVRLEREGGIPVMKLVVKIGGAALEDKALLKKCAQAVADLAAEGHKVAVVHGGGKALTQTLAQMGKESEFVNGLRVTDSETRDVALMVLAGRVNKQLVAAIYGRQGRPAVGLCGGDGAAFLARKKKPNGGDLGFVGEISSVDSRWIEAIWDNDGIPVISSLALGSDGEYYNVNADQMASACASGCQANALIFLTDVEGVKGADGTVIRWLTTSDIPQLVASSVVGGGMLPKLQACQDALRSGVHRVRILPALEAEMLPGVLPDQDRVRHGGHGIVSLSTVQKAEEKYLLHTYDRYPILLTHGKGAYLYADDGSKYLDFLSGIGVMALGYSHPAITKVIAEQAGKLVHCSNLFLHEYPSQLAQKLSEALRPGPGVFLQQRHGSLGGRAEDCARRAPAARTEGTRKWRFWPWRTPSTDAPWVRWRPRTRRSTASRSRR